MLAKLKCHKLVHTEEKNFVCEECAAKFKRKDDLKSHMKIHLPDDIRLIVYIYNNLRIIAPNVNLDSIVLLITNSA